jgi:hypothetical protein
MGDHPYILSIGVSVMLLFTYIVLPLFLCLLCFLLVGSRRREREYGDALRGIADRTKAVGADAVARQRDDMLLEARKAVYKQDGSAGHADG